MPLVSGTIKVTFLFRKAALHGLSKLRSNVLIFSFLVLLQFDEGRVLRAGSLICEVFVLLLMSSIRSSILFRDNSGQSDHTYGVIFRRL